MKQCSKCKRTLSKSQFSKSSRQEDGLQPYCKDCAKEYDEKYRQKDKEKKRAYDKKWCQKNRKKNIKKRIKYNEKNRKRDKEKKTMYTKRWRKNNPGRRQATDSKRRANLILRCPKWLTPEQEQQIIDFYINCPKGMVVDHIYPLQGKYVSGLHHPDNLQYLTKSENCKKGNKCPEIDDLW